MATSKTSILVILLLAVAVLGIFASTKPSPTGMASSGEGFATVDVAGTVAITIPDSHVNLSLHVDTAENPGAYVNTNSSSAIISSAGTGAGAGSYSNENWLNVSDGAVRSIAADKITVNNTGSVISNITVSAGSTPDNFFGASGGNFWVKMNNATSGNGAGCTHIQALDWVEYTTNSSDLCGRLQAQDGNDAIDLWIKWQVPAATTAGSYNSTLTISAAQAS